MENKNYPGSYYQPLFDLLNQEHGITPLESEMTDIIFVVEKMRDKQEGPRWVKCSDRMPEISKPPKLLTVKRYEAIPEIYSTRAVTAAQLADIIKYDFANFEWLDEQHAAGREEDAVLGILQYISESEFYYNHAEKAWLIKGTHSIKLTHNELIEKYELFKQQHNP